MSTITRVSLMISLLALALGAQSAEFDAKAYHDNKCMGCHDTGVYTREDRRVTSMAALESQVARCDANLGTKLFPDDLSLLVDHLNTSYYKFAK
ncbi:cytochrome c [Thiosocius teredinicola]|uniref:cytochrome c n=1 Tax=Thiosocius teredinicola TaxID=1973002 RepID=UPI000F7858D7